MAKNDKIIEGSAEYAIFFDDVRVDSLVKNFDVSISCDGSIGSASIDMVYTPMLYKIRTTDGNGFVSDEDGIENMTQVKIFIKNMFNNKYILVFDGNIKGKSLSRSQGSYSLTFTANDYMAWLNRTIVPIAIPLDESLTTGDKLRWKVQGINPQSDVIAKFTNRNAINFKGETIREIVSKVLNNTMLGNSIYSATDGVAAWDDAARRISVLGDIDPRLREQKVLDFVVSNDVSVSSIYVMINDLIKTLLFEFYQDRDGIIKIKPPYWNERILYDHIIDPSLIVSYVESVNWNNYFTRIIVTGGLEESQQNSDSRAKSIVTPVVAYALNSPNNLQTDFINDVSYTSDSNAQQIDSWPQIISSSDSGDYVKQLQNMLLALSYSEVGNADGMMGPKTSSAIRHFQRDNSCGVDGIVGPQTKAALKAKFQNTSSVGNDAFLNPTTEEKKYGVAVYEAQQPLIKFSNSDVFLQPAKDACAALVQYSKFMISLLNSSVTVASLQTVAMPWIRPGFNCWIDPIGIDKVFYVSAVTHQGGAQSGVFTSLRLSFGRSSASFSMNQNSFGSLKDAKDNIFVNQIFSEYKPEAMGQTIGSSGDFISVRGRFNNFYNTSSSEVIKADSGNPHYNGLYGKVSVFPVTAHPASDTPKPVTTAGQDKYNIDSWPGIMRNGSRGDGVSNLQRFLSDYGFNPGSVDGIYGPNTAAAVTRFQSSAGASADGVVGPETKGKAKQREGYSQGGTSGGGSSYNIDNWPRYLFNGSSGQGVRELQSLLSSLGFGQVGAADGIFGPNTDSGVRAFQSANGLEVDGIVGPNTKAALRNKMPGASNSSSSTPDCTNNLNASKIWSGEYSISYLQTAIGSLYNSAPPVIQNRRNKIKSIVSDSNQYIKTHYITER